MLSTPPALVSLGVVDPGELWIVERALYGLKEAPKYWEEKRDATLGKLEVKAGNKSYKLHRSSVHHSIWHIYDKTLPSTHKDPVDMAIAPVPVLPVLRGKPIATIGVYVDDFLYCGPPELLGPFHQELSRSFDVGTLNVLGRKDCTSLTFVGITMEVDPLNSKQLHLHQASYAYSLLDRFPTI